MEDDDLQRLEDELNRLFHDVVDRLKVSPAELARRLTATRMGAVTAGEEFVALLLEWIAADAAQRAQGHRYLLMWYAKTLAQRSRLTVPDRDAVVKAIEARLSERDVDAVREVLRIGKWDAIRNARSIQVYAERLRRRFVAWLGPAREQRVRPYLSALLVPAGLGGTPFDRPEEGPTWPGAVPSAPWLTTAAIVVALPVIATVAWYLTRYRAAPDAAPVSAATRPVQTGVAPAAHPPTRMAGEPVGGSGAPSPSAPAITASTDATYAWATAATGTTAMLNGIAWSGAHAVVVGRGGTILTSDDGSTWTARRQLGSYAYYGVAFGVDRFVAVGTTREGSHLGQLISTSRDGVTWESAAWRERPGLTEVAYGAGAFVAVGNQGAIVRSTDGTSWQTMASTTGEHLLGVTFGGGRFVVLGKNGLTLTSSDGVHWAADRSADVGAYYRVAHGVGLDVAVGTTTSEPGQAMVRISDGREPREQALKLAPLDAVAFGGGRWLAVGRHELATSSDGRTWHVEATLAHGGRAVVWTGDAVLVAGYEGMIARGVVAQ